jgi:hypothetical protein
MAQVITCSWAWTLIPRNSRARPVPLHAKFCPFCACDHLWHKEDSKFLAPKTVLRPHIQQAS